MAKTIIIKGAMKADKPLTKKQFEALQKKSAKKNTKKK